ncbi:nitrate/nitrite transport system permease protein [Marinagarivorans cellulosilyticus]|uniref:Nitrate/nitrite transport system permease protein n=1 Tax=Marinagarivorans cellulosilyticus TaxID=2721545 RepID=A0AAN2BKM9_9GAMM|nr:nitrate/nitrite transport system permease protein [Marinagarivorans cellulosilyticus]
MINKITNFFNLAGLTWFVPITRMAAGENPKEQLKQLWLVMGIPIVAFALFLMLWGQLANSVETSLGKIPGPTAVYEEAKGLWAEHKETREKEAAFYQRQETRNAKKLEKNPDAEVKWRTYTGKSTYIDQIYTSLKTVFMGFLIATIIAVPLGIFCGLSPIVSSAFNPIIQIFKPVSPLAWLPIVTMVVSATYVTSDEAWFEKSFLTSAITVTLCSLWPTLINTAVGVSSIDKDLMNVGKVLKLGWWTKITKLVLPSSLPLIFTGLRLSLGVGWMVLIAAEMLAQNPGLGKFVWDEFQNGSSHSLGRIMVAVLTIGIIGFLLDRVMSTLQTLFTFDVNR